MSGVLQGFTVIFIVIGAGYLLGRLRLLGPDAQQVLARLVFFVATPALLFNAIADTAPRDLINSTLVVSGISAFVIGGGYFAWARWRRRSTPDAMIGALASSYVNSSNLGIPVATFILHDTSFVAPLLMFQIMIYSPVALTVLDLTALRRPSGAPVSGHQWWRITLSPFVNPILLGGALGLVFAFGNWTLPAVLAQPVTMLADMSVPGALLTFGLSLAGVVVLQRDSPRTEVFVASACKMIGQPLLVYVIARFGFHLSGHHLYSCVVIAALPTAQNVLVYATRYGRSEILARDAAVVTTLAAIPVIALTTLLLA